jgi:hypothetical protein
MNIEKARGIVAQAWCQPSTAQKEMDIVLGEEFAEILVGQTSISAAMNTLKDAMQDDDMANGWHANIAVLLTDEGVDYDNAQERAAGFMKMVFDRNTLGLPR